VAHHHHHHHHHCISALPTTGLIAGLPHPWCHLCCGVDIDYLRHSCHRQTSDAFRFVTVLWTVAWGVWRLVLS
jgi:hypothetical protein